jgi:hypothetical protein
MSEYVYAGLTSQSIDILIQDSSSTIGAGLSGLVYNSSGLVASYRKGATGSRTAITLATQTVGGAYSSGGFVEIESTHMKGVYRIDLPNAAVDTEGFVTLYLYGATNMLPVALRIDCRPLPVDVKKFGGTALTSASGIPEVKVASIASSAIATATFATGATLPRVTLVDTCTTNSDMRGTDNAALAVTALSTAVWTSTIAGRIDVAVSTRLAPLVAGRNISVAATTGAVELDSAARVAIWNTLTTETFTADSFGELLLISDGTNGRAVKVTGANHIAADVHDCQADGLSGSTEIAAINTFATRVTTGLVQDGAVYQFTANMLELAPSGGGGSSVNVLPATGIVADRSAGATLVPVVGETISQSITLYRTDGTTAISLSGKTLVIVFETLSGVDVATVASGSITISGASSNIVTFAYPSAVTASERTLRFAIRDAAAPSTLYMQGVCSVVRAPQVDA